MPTGISQVIRHIADGRPDCPFCGNDIINRSDRRSMVGKMSQECSCRRCGRIWVEHYHIVNITMLPSFATFVDPTVVDRTEELNAAVSDIMRGRPTPQVDWDFVARDFTATSTGASFIYSFNDDTPASPPEAEPNRFRPEGDQPL